MKADKTAFLRPQFTALLTAQLVAGDSLNLISPHGQGRRRTLHDLRQNLPADLQLFYFNMRTYKSDYKGFHNSICMRMKTRSSTENHLHRLLDKLEQQHANSLFILHNFDELRQSKSIDCDYDNNFFQALRSIRKRHNIALLCVSEMEYKHYRLQADGSAQIDSHINATSITLPVLNEAQLLAELRRRDGSKTEQQLRTLHASLLHHPTPYSALDQLFPVKRY